MNLKSSVNFEGAAWALINAMSLKERHKLKGAV